jgi:alkylation response protein AidB-like acyl-CoA dehydrogenase
MMEHLTFSRPPDVDGLDLLRAEVREFLAVELSDRSPAARAESWTASDTAFSRKVGQRGWIGMTWPKQYGGHERTSFERYVVLEEMLAAGAPVSAHWIADRQSGPLILRVGTDEQKMKFLPAIARGECFISAGLSEPDTGSDLASARTRAVAVEGGYIVNGTKVWTTNAHLSHFLILFCRTSPYSRENRHEGFSQFIIDLASPGIHISPILDLAGKHHINQIIFEDVFVPESSMLGARGDGWKQVISELANERSGPERFLSSFTLLVELARELGINPSNEATAAIGRLAAHTGVLRSMSRSVAGMLHTGTDPTMQAAIVKDLGAVLEQEIPEVARRLVASEPSVGSEGLAAVLATTLLQAPSFSLRGGAREILRGIIARGLGLR